VRLPERSNLPAHQLELVHAPPDVRLGDVDVTLGVDVQRVAVRVFAELVAGAAELGDLVALVIEDVHHLVASVGDDHVFLRWERLPLVFLVMIAGTAGRCFSSKTEAILEQ